MCVEACDTVLQTFPTDLTSLMYKADALFAQNETMGAIDCLSNAHSSFSSSSVMDKEQQKLEVGCLL